MPFRLERITTQMRVELGCTLVARSGEYGLVTRLAREHDVSRQFLYDLKERTERATRAALAPRPLGRTAVGERLWAHPLAVKRAILVLSQAAHASVRAIGECLEEILGVRPSVGTIHGVLEEAARRARALLFVPERPIQAEADELYAAGKPVLEVVDHRSSLIVALEPAERAEETAWGLTWLELLEERGVKVERVLCDGAAGLRAGLREAGGPEPSLDHWHALRELGRIERSVEKEAYKRLEALERRQREAGALAHRARYGRRPSRGRPLKESATDPRSLEAAHRAAEEAVERYDGAHYVLEVVREVLAPVEARTGRVRTSEEVRGELKAAGSLLKELGAKAARAGALLGKRAGELATHLDWLRERLGAAYRALGEEAVGFLAWAWRHRGALGVSDAAQAWPAEPEAARQVWEVLEDTPRSSGMVENLGSLLAAHRASHRGLPAPVLEVFKVYRNHRVFERGKRVGHSPLELAGLPTTSPHWLDALGYGRTSVEKERRPVPKPHQSVNTLAA